MTQTNHTSLHKPCPGSLTDTWPAGRKHNPMSNNVDPSYTKYKQDQAARPPLCNVASSEPNYLKLFTSGPASCHGSIQPRSGHPTCHSRSGDPKTIDREILRDRPISYTNRRAVSCYLQSAIHIDIPRASGVRFHTMILALGVT
jgi:hypothetical protein